MDLIASRFSPWLSAGRAAYQRAASAALCVNARTVPKENCCFPLILVFLRFLRGDNHRLYRNRSFSFYVLHSAFYILAKLIRQKILMHRRRAKEDDETQEQEGDK